MMLLESAQIVCDGRASDSRQRRTSPRVWTWMPCHRSPSPPQVVVLRWWWWWWWW